MLSELDVEALDKIADAWAAIKAVILDGGSESVSKQDRAEAVFYIHGLQNMILANSAARAHPGEYRLLGQSILDSVKF